MESSGIRKEWIVQHSRYESCALTYTHTHTHTHAHTEGKIEKFSKLASARCIKNIWQGFVFSPTRKMTRVYVKIGQTIYFNKREK